ncbi:MAG: DUF4416 family protein [Planctomycetota bacterium]
MAEVLTAEPVVRICAVISRDDDLRAEAIEHLTEEWGKPICRTEPLPFQAGGYYTPTMGADLRKELVGFSNPLDGGPLADWKLWTNRLEVRLAATRIQGDAVSESTSVNSRPINLDPGYVTQAKLVLATTKDRDHRVYLRDGIYGEVTLNYTAKRWVSHRWTYPDYRTEEVAAFATSCRQYLRQHLQETAGFRSRG